MKLIIILILSFFGAMFLKGFINMKSTKLKPKSFHGDFKISKTLTSLSEKGKIENVLYIDSDSKKALWCNQIKKKTNIIKEFQLSDVRKVQNFQDIMYDNKDKKNVYVKTFGLKLHLSDGTKIPLYFMNDDAYVVKPNYVYDLTQKERSEYKSLLKA